MHPGAGWGQEPGGHVLFLMCDDVERTRAELEGSTSRDIRAPYNLPPRAVSSTGRAGDS
jgi:hypothetical protein